MHFWSNDNKIISKIIQKLLNKEKKNKIGNSFDSH